MLSHSTLFNSPIKNAPRLALPFFIVLAAFLHLSTIYLFKIVYQPSHVSKPVPAQVFFLSPNSPSSQQIASWLKSNDPSIFSPLKTVQATRPALPSSIYDPQLTSLSLHPLPLLPKNSAADLLPPTNEIGLPYSTTDHPVSTAAVKIPAVQNLTIIKPCEELSMRATRFLGAPTLPKELNTSLPPTQLTLNVDPEGTPRHVIVSQSSGNAAADEAASRWAMTLHFEKAEHETWGTLLVLWGNR